MQSTVPHKSTVGSFSQTRGDLDVASACVRWLQDIAQEFELQCFLEEQSNVVVQNGKENRVEAILCNEAFMLSLVAVRATAPLRVVSAKLELQVKLWQQQEVRSLIFETAPTH